MFCSCKILLSAIPLSDFDETTVNIVNNDCYSKEIVADKGKKHYVNFLTLEHFKFFLQDNYLHF